MGPGCPCIEVGNTTSTRRNLYLVGGLEHVIYFPMTIGNLIIPIDEIIFFRGVALAHQPVDIVDIVEHIDRMFAEMPEEF